MWSDLSEVVGLSDVTWSCLATENGGQELLRARLLLDWVAGSGSGNNWRFEGGV